MRSAKIRITRKACGFAGTAIFLLAPCLALAQSPTIDGNLNDLFWSARARVWTIDVPQGQADFRLGYDDRFLYCAAQVPASDAVLLMLDFGDGNDALPTAATFEFRFSRKGDVTWRQADEPPASLPLPADHSTDVKVQTSNASSQLTSWALEAKIPWTQLGQQPPIWPNRVVGLNFACATREPNKPERLHSILPDVTESNHRSPCLWQRISLGWLAPLSIRARLQPLPLGLDTQPGTDATDPGLDRNTWTDLLADMRRLRLNTLILDHPGPLVGLVAPPAAASLPAGITRNRIDRNIEQLTWLLAEAKRNNISVYLGVLLSPANADASAAFTTLFDTYPDLAGLVLQAAQDLPEDQNPIAEIILPALRDAARKRGSDSAPQLLLSTRHLSVNQIRTILRAYPAARLLADLQPSGSFDPTVDPHLSTLLANVAAKPNRRATPRISAVGLITPQPAQRYLYAGDPAWMHALTLDARRHGLDGLVYAGDDTSWLAAEALAAYAVNSPDAYSPVRWQQRLEEACGVGPYAAQLLETIRHACGIIPALVAAVDARSDHYMPQMGMPLVNYLELPTQQSPRNPKATASEINNHIQTCEARLTSLRHLKPDNPIQARTLEQLLDRVELNVAMGRHFQARLRAAAAWTRFKAGIAPVKDFLTVLQEASNAWPRVVQASSKLYPHPIDYWRVAIVSPPPWPPREILAGLEPATGGWADHSSILRRELDILSAITAKEPAAARLPLWDRLNAVPDNQLNFTTRVSFDLPYRDRRYTLSQGATITQQPEFIIKGKGSLLVDTRDLGPGPHVVLRTMPEFATLRRYRPHQVSLAYHVIERASDDVFFELGAVPSNGGPEFGTYRRWSAPPGTSDEHFTQLPARQQENDRVYLTIHGQALLAIDNFTIATPN